MIKEPRSGGMSVKIVLRCNLCFSETARYTGPSSDEAEDKATADGWAIMNVEHVYRGDTYGFLVVMCPACASIEREYLK